jgi:hypothetical protein
MRSAFLFLCAALLAATCVAQARPFSADFASGGKLRMHVRSGEVHILGADQDKISVEVSGKKANEARDLRIHVKERGGATDLRISGGPRKDITITIHIPRNTDLYARIPGGEVRVEGVTGNKDIELHGGELVVAVGNAADYAHIDASVYIGELDGHPFGEEHGGFFRSFHKEGSGKYRLHAHVGAGQLTLR